MMKVRFVLLLSLALVLVPGAFADITGFIGPYAQSNWTATGTVNPPYVGTFGVTTTATTADLTYNLPWNALQGGCGTANCNPYSGSWTYKTTAAETGSVTFDWSYDYFHAYFRNNASVQLIDFSTNQTITLFSGAYPASLPVTGAGATIAVNAGDTFGFRISGSNSDFESAFVGDLKLTNFSAPGTVPDGGWTLMLLGGSFAMLGVVRAVAWRRA